MDSKTFFKHCHNSPERFEENTLEAFRYQYQNNLIYQRYCDLIGRNPQNVSRLSEIPFLPVTLFRDNRITCFQERPEIVFYSSTTSSDKPSKHYIKDLQVYHQSFMLGFECFYGRTSEHTILALLPGYLERKNASLVYMVDHLIKKTNDSRSGFFLNEYKQLHTTLSELESENKPTILIGVSFALLDFAKKFPKPLRNTIIMETGGMKGKSVEITKEELHQTLKNAFGVKHIHSEYGMTELLSQAYSKGNGIFQYPPWMKFFTFDPQDPFTQIEDNRTGTLCIIDLANIDSCSFIATEDLGRIKNKDNFELIGRLDNADIRGCNLLFS